MRWAVASCLLLAGCATAYQPVSLEVTDAAKNAADVDFCLAAARAYRPSMSAGGVAQGIIEGAGGAISYAPINPLIPVLGASGGAASAVSNGFDLTGQVRRNVAKHCIAEKTRRDGSAIVANPDN